VILPATRLLWALTALVGAAIGVALFKEFQPQWTVLAAAFASICVVDLLLAVRLPALVVARQVPASLSLGVPVDVRLRVRNASRAALALQVYDHHPHSFESRGLPRRVALGPGQWAEVSYEARPVARGEARFSPSEVRLSSPLRLWQAARRAGAAR